MPLPFFTVTFTATPAEVKTALDQANDLASIAMDQRRRMMTDQPQLMQAKLDAYRAEVQAEFDLAMREKDEIIEQQQKISYEASRTLSMMYEQEQTDEPFEQWLDAITTQ